MKNKRNRRIITTVVVVVILVGAVVAYFVFRGRENLQQMIGNLQTEEIDTGSLVATIGATGIVRANQSATLAWETSGTVEQVLFAVGDDVEAGDVLATLEQKSLPQSLILAQAELVSAKQALEDLYEAYSDLALAQAAQAVANAQDAVDFYETTLNNLKSPAKQVDIDQAEANLILAQEKLDKAREDFEPYEKKPDSVTKAAFQSALAQAQKEYDNAARYLNNLQGTANEIDLAIAEADLALAKEQMTEAQEQYDEIKAGPSPDDVAAAEARIASVEATLAMAYIDVPFSGTVTQVVPKSGDQVSPGMIAFRIDDLSRMLLDVQISEIDINSVHVGQEATLVFDAILDEEYQGEIVSVSPVGVSQQGVVNFDVSIELLDPDEKVKPGMTAAVNIVFQQLENVLLVPNRAVRMLEGDRVVYILGEDNMLEVVQITLGASSDLYSEILEGDLEIGTKVVLNPPAIFEANGPPEFVRR
jgi:HlyD family secretion protein